jgi:hypothetical protein
MSSMQFTICTNTLAGVQKMKKTTIPLCLIGIVLLVLAFQNINAIKGLDDPGIKELGVEAIQNLLYYNATITMILLGISLFIVVLGREKGW